MLEVFSPKSSLGARRPYVPRSAGRLGSSRLKRLYGLAYPGGYGALTKSTSQRRRYTFLLHSWTSSFAG